MAGVVIGFCMNETMVYERVCVISAFIHSNMILNSDFGKWMKGVF
jgi:hypothetical protein